MDIGTAKEARRQCESEIRAIINMFQQQTGLQTHGVSIIYSEEFGLLGKKVAAVSIDARLED